MRATVSEGREQLLRMAATRCRTASPVRFLRLELGAAQLVQLHFQPRPLRLEPGIVELQPVRQHARPCAISEFISRSTL